MCGREMAYLGLSGQWYSNKTSVEIPGVYDGGLFYADVSHRDGCGKAWHRWHKGHPLREKAQPYIDDWNKKADEGQSES